MRKYFFQVFLFFLFLFHNEILANDSIHVHVTVVGFKNEKGTCRLLLFKEQKGFPENPTYAILALNSNINKDSTHFHFKVIPGVYAISILHDENTNGKIDKTWYGKPTEGFGVSNNPKIRRSIPAFKESRINVDERNNSLLIRLNYL